jgi:hypothetical protein
MLTLEITAPGTRVPPLPEPSDPHATVWRDQAGTICAWGQTVDGEHWIHVPQVATFAFSPARPTVSAVPAHAAARDLLVDAFRRTVLPLALQALGRQVLHASGVEIDGRVVAFCALSGIGKSTVAGGLSRRGHALWADDAVCFEAAGQTVIARGLPFTLRLRPESARFLGRDRADGSEGGPSDRPLAAIVVLERAPAGRGVQVTRLSQADAFRAAMTHGYCFTLADADQRRTMIADYFDLVERVPVHRLRFEPGLGRLREMLEAIEDAVR